MMGKEEDGRPPRPSDSISPTQGHYVPVNSFYPPFMMHQNLYSYNWSNQHPSMPLYGPNIHYAQLSNPVDLRPNPQINQHLSMPPYASPSSYPQLSNPADLRPNQETIQEESDGDYTDQEMKVDQHVEACTETVEKEQKQPPEKLNSLGHDENEDVQKRRFLDLNELAPGSGFDYGSNTVINDEDTNDF